ncbi:hypothetical protein AVEN_157954-1 [Araneus ventricosus]|uniref:Uncharacterized protein n=1 Tax=Araneus ventricosus TaxID=182803 RepID=A0A4Y2UBV6_ARAVE|nr:hypothetical protein AVEN_157954-1 [Araneus ventricosus]
MIIFTTAVGESEASHLEFILLAEEQFPTVLPRYPVISSPSSLPQSESLLRTACFRVILLAEEQYTVLPFQVSGNTLKPVCLHCRSRRSVRQGYSTGGRTVHAVLPRYPVSTLNNPILTTAVGESVRNSPACRGCYTAEEQYHRHLVSVSTLNDHLHYHQSEVY